MRRTMMAVTGTAAGLVALAVSFLTGRVLAPDPVADDLGRGCRDTVPTAAAKTFLESDHLQVTEEVPLDTDGRETDALRCDVRPAAITSPEEESASISVVISPAQGAQPYLVPASTSGTQTAPFGHGWVGSYGPDDTGGGTATLLLECARQPGGGLMVLVEGGWDRADHELAAQKHAQLAVVAARLARQAHQAWGCDGQPGQIPDSVTVAASGYPRTPVKQAKGTCEGLVSAQTASGLGVDNVSEVPAGLALAEDCRVYGEDETYYLSASYGPAADDARSAPWSDDYQMTATATCGRGQGEAFYGAEAGEGWSQVEPANPHAFREMFDAFVAASAERHGCELGDQRQPEPSGQDATDVRELAGELAESDSAANALPPTTDTARAILPASAAIPDGAEWTNYGPQTHSGAGADICADIPDLCRGVRAHGTNTFGDSDDEGNYQRSIEFTALAYDTALQAQQAVQAAQNFFAQFQDARNEDYRLLEPDDLAHFGEDGLGVTAQDYTQLEDESLSASISCFAQGPYVGVLRIVDNDMGTRWDLMEHLGGTYATRMDEAEAGQRPTTTNAYDELAH